MRVVCGAQRILPTSVALCRVGTKIVVQLEVPDSLPSSREVSVVESMRGERWEHANHVYYEVLYLVGYDSQVSHRCDGSAQ